MNYSDQNLQEPGVETAPDKKPKSISIPTLLLEVFSIVLGVLLALALSEWSEDRQNRERADSAMQNVVNEIRANTETLRLIHKNNADTITIIKSENRDKDDPLTIIPGAQLQETAWDALLSTGLSSFVDYETILNLSQMYAIQRVYKEAGQQVGSAAMQSTAYAAAMGTELDNDHFLQQFVGYFELLSSIEAQLLVEYSKILGQLDG